MWRIRGALEKVKDTDQQEASLYREAPGENTITRAPAWTAASDRTTTSKTEVETEERMELGKVSVEKTAEIKM